MYYINNVLVNRFFITCHLSLNFLLPIMLVFIYCSTAKGSNGNQYIELRIFCLKLNFCKLGGISQKLSDTMAKLPNIEFISTCAWLDDYWLLYNITKYLEFTGIGLLAEDFIVFFFCQLLMKFFCLNSLRLYHQICNQKSTTQVNLPYSNLPCSYIYIYPQWCAFAVWPLFLVYSIASQYVAVIHCCRNSLYLSVCPRAVLFL